MATKIRATGLKITNFKDTSMTTQTPWKLSPALSELKDRYAGERAMIIGKGPSLDTLSPSTLVSPDAVVFCLNEAIRKIEQLGFTHHTDIYVVQQDCDERLRDRCVPQGLAVHLMNCWQSRWSGFKWKRIKLTGKSEWNPKAILYDPADFGEADVELSAVMALHLAKFMGISKVTFCCFDSWGPVAERNLEYAECVEKLGCKSGDLGDPGRHVTHKVYILKKAKELGFSIDTLHPHVELPDDGHANPDRTDDRPRVRGQRHRQRVDCDPDAGAKTQKDQKVDADVSDV